MNIFIFFFILICLLFNKIGTYLLFVLHNKFKNIGFNTINNNISYDMVHYYNYKHIIIML